MSQYMPMAGMILKSLRQATSHAINLANSVCANSLTWVPIIYICQIQKFQDEDYNISLKSIYEKEEKWKKNIVVNPSPKMCLFNEKKKLKPSREMSVVQEIDNITDSPQITR